MSWIEPGIFIFFIKLSLFVIQNLFVIVTLAITISNEIVTMIRMAAILLSCNLMSMVILTIGSLSGTVAMVEFSNLLF